MQEAPKYGCESVPSSRSQPLPSFLQSQGACSFQLPAAISPTFGEILFIYLQTLLFLAPVENRSPQDLVD